MTSLEIDSKRGVLATAVGRFALQHQTCQARTCPLNLSGMIVNTQVKSNGNDPKNDVVFVGHMKNLDDSEKIVVITGPGDDALVLEGMLGRFSNNPQAGRLDATLGSGHNTLNLHGIGDVSEIRGIYYDPETSTLKYYHGESRAQHLVGKVTFVFLNIYTRYILYLQGVPK